MGKERLESAVSSFFWEDQHRTVALDYGRVREPLMLFFFFLQNNREEAC